MTTLGETNEAAAVGEPTAPPHSVLGVIASGEWKSALFTTYTLSLTYVESHVLPALRRSNCETLTILADTAGYRDSLMEQRSQGVGRDYSVLPVRVSRGIFHPKLVYLEARDAGEDLLLVGSGNVTYPGHGGNVEVLEVLRAATAATAFAQCADFLRDLLENDNVQVPEGAALSRAIERMRSSASAGGDVGDVQFIHSLATSGKDQMVASALRIGGAWRELTVLSPYHHPNAAPILVLAEAVGVSELLVGVPSREGDPSAFPFQQARSRFPGLRTVAPVPSSKPQRNLHAKWFELRGDAGSLALTGSFNATNASFASTDNVECGVLRLMAEPSTAWKEVAEPPYQAGEFPTREDSRRPCVFVVLAESFLLQGVLLTGQAAGVWALTLESAEEVLLRTEVQVESGGHFQFPLGTIDTTRVGTLQVTLEQGQVLARGWVQIAQVLRLEARNRRLLDAVFRSAAGNQTPEDSQTLLDIIFQEASQVIQTSVVPKSHSGSSPSSPRATVQISGAQFAALSSGAEPEKTGAQDSLLNALNAGARGLDLLDALMAALQPRLGQPMEADTPSHKKPEAADDPFSKKSNAGTTAEPDDPGAQASRQKRARKVTEVYEALHKRLREFNDLLLRQPGQTASIEKSKLRLLRIWLGTVLMHQVQELQDPDGALAFLSGTWMREVCGVRLPWDEKEWLAKHVCGVAAACAHGIADGSSARAALGARQDDVRQAMNPGRELHRRLSAFFGPALPQEQVLQAARTWLEDPRTSALVAEQVDEAVAALQDFLSLPTERQVLLKLLEEGADAQEKELADFSPELESTLRQLARTYSQTPQRVSFVDVRNLDRCPSGRCDYPYMATQKGGPRHLESGISWRLNKFGVYRCRCNQFVVAREVA